MSTSLDTLNVTLAVLVNRFLDNARVIMRMSRWLLITYFSTVPGHCTR